jgi:hypothetical protein
MESILRDEIESAHMYLDDLNIPREGEKGTYSLVGRIKRLEARFYEEASELETYYLTQNNSNGNVQ